jgi:hypothetical protein
VAASQFNESILGLQISIPGRASAISNQPPTPDDGESITVRRPEPGSKVIYSDSNEAEQASSEMTADESSTGRRLLIVFMIFLVLGILAAGIVYWVQARQFPVVVAISPPDRPAKPDPLGDRGTLVPVRPDLLHVTSIALGTPRLTIVNGKRLAEEDWLVVKTPQGEASVRVILIQDGLVRFKHGGETIDARLQMANASPSPH